MAAAFPVKNPAKSTLNIGKITMWNFKKPASQKPASHQLEDDRKKALQILDDIGIPLIRNSWWVILLKDTEQDSFIEKITEENHTMLFIGNEKNVFIFDSPFQEIWAKVEIDPDCTCQTLK